VALAVSIIALVVVLAAGVAPASAFVGESAVLNGAKTDLTGPAKTIITNPTFLPESVDGAAALGGSAEASGAAGVFEAATVLPALGSVLSFGVGTVVGSEICNVIGIEGCWYFGSDGADPAPGGSDGGSWVFRTEKITAELGTYPAFNWYWQQAGGSLDTLWGGVEGNPTSCGPKPPSSASAILPWKHRSTFCSGVGTVTVTNTTARRDAMANRHFDYHATDQGGVSNYAPGGKPYAADPKWSEKTAAALKEHAGDEAARLGQHIASQIAGSKVADPYPHKVTIPSCSGESWVECKADLEELELVPERVELGWSDAHLDLAPDEVVELEPAPATQVEVPSESTVIVTTNPDEAGMPLVVPTPESGETYDHYAARLNPSLNPERHDLEAAFVDPAAGPNGVVAVSPEPETRLDPAVEHDVKVTTNPADAPAPLPAWSPPTIPAVDMSPLMATGLGCSVFPFGLPCYVVQVIESLNVTPHCPEFEVPLYGGNEMTIDGCVLDPVLSIWRPAFLFVASICIVIFFAHLAGVGGGSEDDA